MTKWVKAEDLKVGDEVADAPEGVRVTSVKELPGPIQITWEDGEVETYERCEKFELRSRA